MSWFKSKAKTTKAPEFVYSREEMIRLKKSKNAVKNFVLPAGLECLYRFEALAELAGGKVKLVLTAVFQSSGCRELARDILLIPSICDTIHRHGTPYLRALVEMHKELRRLEMVTQLLESRA
ncbi:hypothetical protein Aduo_008186 [Ancylostoma duodenale]